MRLLLLALLTCCALSACANSSRSPTSPPDVDHQPPAEPGHLVVYVYWEGGSPGKQIKVIETEAVKLTDEAGLAGFTLTPGTYTVRAWGIGLPGPGREFVDFPATVRSGETTRIEIFDCVPCV